MLKMQQNMIKYTIKLWPLIFKPENEISTITFNRFM